MAWTPTSWWVARSSASDIASTIRSSGEPSFGTAPSFWGDGQSIRATVCRLSSATAFFKTERPSSQAALVRFRRVRLDRLSQTCHLVPVTFRTDFRPVRNAERAFCSVMVSGFWSGGTSVEGSVVRLPGCRGRGDPASSDSAFAATWSCHTAASSDENLSFQPQGRPRPHAG